MCGADDELEEIDVVSVTSCSWNGAEVHVDDVPRRAPAHPAASAAARRQMLVLPAAESMSAQVAAMHNYSNPPHCRPTPAATAAAFRSTVAVNSVPPPPSSCPAKFDRRYDHGILLSLFQS